MATFSPQRAFSESADGKAGIARLTALQTEKARQIDDRNKAVQTQEQTLQQSAFALTDEARIRRTREVEQFRIDVQRFIQDAQAEVTGVQRELESSFPVKLRRAVAQIARDRGRMFGPRPKVTMIGRRWVRRPHLSVDPGPQVRVSLKQFERPPA